MKEDLVNNPSHYNQSGIECIQAIEASLTKEHPFSGMLKGNVIKYLWRYIYKGNPLQDLRKARWYLDKLIEFEEKIYAQKLVEEAATQANLATVAKRFHEGKIPVGLSTVRSISEFTRQIQESEDYPISKGPTPGIY